MFTALVLIALSLGYIVLVMAVKEKGSLRTLGITVGVAVMTISVVTFAAFYLSMVQMRRNPFVGHHRGMMAPPAQQAPAGHQGIGQVQGPAKPASGGEEEQSTK